METGPEIAGDTLLGADAAHLPTMTLPGDISGARKAGFQSLIRQSAIVDIENHGKASMGAEVCGVLLGNVYQDASGPLLYIRSIIRGDPATGNVSQVTFTSQTWTHIHEELDRNFPDERIVGWYHTHPGHGIFLSGMDLFIHENFFNLTWQVALVFDPHSGEHGLFVWKDQKTIREEFLIENDYVAPLVVDDEPLAEGTGEKRGGLRLLLSLPILIASRLLGKRRASAVVQSQKVDHE